MATYERRNKKSPGDGLAGALPGGDSLDGVGLPDGDDVGLSLAGTAAKGKRETVISLTPCLIAIRFEWII